MGEVVMRGNLVMKGYWDDEDATATAFRGGWFHSGDLGVSHADGSIELRDRMISRRSLRLDLLRIARSVMAMNPRPHRPF